MNHHTSSTFHLFYLPLATSKFLLKPRQIAASGQLPDHHFTYFSAFCTLSILLDMFGGEKGLMDVPLTILMHEA